MTVQFAFLASTSRSTCKRSPTTKLKQSPLKAGYISKFQKIREFQSKKLLKRSKVILRDICNGEDRQGNNRFIRNKSARMKVKTPKKFLGRSKKRMPRNVNGNTKQTYDEFSSENKGKIDLNDITDSDDDCILVEKCPSHITIVDDDDDGDGDNEDNATANYTTSSMRSTIFQSTVTNEQRNPATNSNSIFSYNQSRPSYANAVAHGPDSIHHNSALFFVDVTEKSYLGNVTYNTVAPLREKSQKNDCEVVTVDKPKTNDKKTTSMESSESESSEEDEDEDEDEDADDDDIEEGEIDDSVVFVSETSKNDFIPINGTTDGSLKLAENPKAPNTQKRPHLYSELFTRTEKKQLEAYNSNTYNPHAGEVFTSKKRMVIIDGSNVAFKHSLDKVFSVRGLRIAIEYFEKMGHEVKAVIPQFRMNNHKSSDPAELEKLHKTGKIVQTPCKNLPGLTSSSYDDRFILQLASELDAVVVSNDNYRDLLHENPAFKKIIETRVVGYTWCNDIFILPKDPYGKWGPTLDMILNRS